MCPQLPLQGLPLRLQPPSSNQTTAYGHHFSCPTHVKRHCHFQIFHSGMTKRQKHCERRRPRRLLYALMRPLLMTDPSFSSGLLSLPANKPLSLFPSHRLPRAELKRTGEGKRWHQPRGSLASETCPRSHLLTCSSCTLPQQPSSPFASFTRERFPGPPKQSESSQLGPPPLPSTVSPH